VSSLFVFSPKYLQLQFDFWRLFYVAQDFIQSVTPSQTNEAKQRTRKRRRRKMLIVDTIFARQPITSHQGSTWPIVVLKHVSFLSCSHISQP
jgi:hypothetical protein